MISYASMLLGRLDSRTGRFADAHRRFDAAREDFLAVGLQADAREVDAMEAECLVLEGRSAEALALADRLLPQVAEHGSVRGSALVQRVRGYALLQRGLHEAAGAALEDSRRSATEHGADYELTLTLVALRSLAEREGGPAAPPAWGAQIAELVERLGIVALPDVPLHQRSAGPPAAETRP